MNKTIILALSVVAIIFTGVIGIVNFSILNSATHICSQEADDGTTYHFYMVDEYEFFVCKYYLPAHNAKYYKNGSGNYWQDPLSIKYEELSDKRHRLLLSIQENMTSEEVYTNGIWEYAANDPIFQEISDEMDEIMQFKSDPTYFANACIEYHMNEVNASIERAKTQPKRDRQREEEKEKAIQSVAENINCN